VLLRFCCRCVLLRRIGVGCEQGAAALSLALPVARPHLSLSEKSALEPLHDHARATHACAHYIYTAYNRFGAFLKGLQLCGFYETVENLKKFGEAFSSSSSSSSSAAAPPTPLRCDNTAAIALANGDKTSQRSKHINVRFHFIRQAVKDGDVRLDWVPTLRQPADIFTKALGPQPFLRIKPFVMGELEEM
jgi:hypothetical protein